MTLTVLVYQFVLSLLVPAFQATTRDNLLVYGEGFSFFVKEPNQWIGDIENAESYSANIIFYKKGHAINDPNGIIRVRVNEKTDENTAEDLAFDMQGYKKEYPNIQFQDIKVFHLSYKCFPKLFFVKDNFYEYVTYINPGTDFQFTFSVAMNREKVPATADELAAYNSVIASLIFLK